MQKKSFENLTIVSITGSSDYIQGSIYAISRSCRELQGSKGLLISPPLPAGVRLPENIEHIVCAPFGYLEYNLFILYQLDYFIHTDYCLIVQDDGWVLNGNNWREEFWDYDYIGAPVPVLCYYQDNGLFRIESTDFYKNNMHLRDNAQFIEPQNGGFSLRSKRLLGMPRLLQIPYTVTPPDPMLSPPPDQTYKLEYAAKIHFEDMFLSGFHRTLLEQHGIRFAPAALASVFAVESLLITEMLGIRLNSIFGGHFFGQIRLTAENRITMKLRSTILHSYSASEIINSEVVRLFTDKGVYVDIVEG